MKKVLKKLFFALPMPEKLRNKLYFAYKTQAEAKQSIHEQGDFEISPEYTEEYAKYVLNIPTARSDAFVEFRSNEPVEDSEAVKYIAYYLTQFHPNPQNDAWWGKGTTEWTNVSKAVPQYVDHYQPRLPGELGYYDLRLKENFMRQIELAKNYGVHAFCFYYYWFDGERLLEAPLNMFLENKDMDIRFCISWANENWTKRFSGTNTDVLMKIGDDEESDTRFIFSILDMIQDPRYLTVEGKPVVIVYRPANLHHPESVLRNWRKIVREEFGKDLYIIATQEKADTNDWLKTGFDAETEFMPKAVIPQLDEITTRINTLRKDFRGCIYDYEDIVKNKRYYNKRNSCRKVYPAVMPMWDNTARRNQNAVIFQGSTPTLYGQWLDDINRRVVSNKLLDDRFVFLNAWNEWGEGAYLEPDRYWGYAYLQETLDSIRRLKRDDV